MRHQVSYFYLYYMDVAALVKYEWKLFMKNFVLKSIIILLNYVILDV